MAVNVVASVVVVLDVYRVVSIFDDMRYFQETSLGFVGFFFNNLDGFPVHGVARALDVLT